MDWFDNDRKLTNYFSKQANLQQFKLLIFNHVKLWYACILNGKELSNGKHIDVHVHFIVYTYWANIYHFTKYIAFTMHILHLLILNPSSHIHSTTLFKRIAELICHLWREKMSNSSSICIYSDVQLKSYDLHTRSWSVCCTEFSVHWEPHHPTGFWERHCAKAVIPEGPWCLWSQPGLGSHKQPLHPGGPHQQAAGTSIIICQSKWLTFVLEILLVDLALSGRTVLL